MKTPCLLAGILAFVFISCQKEKSVELPNNSPGNSSGNGSNGGNGGSSSGSEIGTWKLMFMHTATSQTVEYTVGSDAFKAVTTSDYITQSNTGTVKFDGSTCTTSGISYSIDTSSTTISYINGAPQDTIQLPFAVTVPPTSGTSQYKKIGTDSLYFQSGVIGTVGSGGTTQTTASGYKLRYYGSDSMTMSAIFNEVEQTAVSGLPTKTTTNASVVISLKKQ